jgi:signal peptidase II
MVKRKYVILSILTTIIIVLDQLTKYEIVERFRYGESVPVIHGFFSLTYVRNTGAAFGLLAHADPAFRIPFFVIVPILALIAIAFVFRKIPDQDLKLSSALSLVIGGAIGNLIDRMTLNYVIDFLDFHWKYQYHFPAFNVADMAICVGVGVLMLDLLTQPMETSAEPEPQTKPKGTGADASAPR